MNKKFTVVICNPTEPIGLGQKVYGGVVSAAYDRELSDAQPAVAVNQRMRTALQEIANTVNYAQWYQETAEKALEDANHTEVALDKVAAVAVNEQLLEAANFLLQDVRRFQKSEGSIRFNVYASMLEAAIAAAQKELNK